MSGKIQWKRGQEPGEWTAYLNGHEVASARVRSGTPTGYWGRYAAFLSRELVTRGESVRKFTTTLGEFKETVRARVSALPAGHKFLATRGTDEADEL